jgi:CCR4-NOT transcription complex subunit 7/8
MYDFGYLLKLATGAPLPDSESEFFALLALYFPNLYDIKYIMKSCRNLKGGLQDVAQELGVARIGPQHQAGSDSLLTCQAFFKLREVYFNDNLSAEKFVGNLYGLGILNNEPNYSLPAAASGNKEEAVI